MGSYEELTEVPFSYHEICTFSALLPCLNTVNMLNLNCILNHEIYIYILKSM